MKHYRTDEEDPQAKVKKSTGFFWQAINVLGELLIAFAVICILYIVWQLWWTGVQAEHAQVAVRTSVSWTNPNKGNNTKIAMRQSGEPPVEGKVKVGELLARAYVPRFGNQWERNIIEGSTVQILNRLGLGHYEGTQLPGQIGNFAVAGHREGYGQALIDVDKLVQGDPIIIRTKNYWFVYRYTTHKIVTPDHTEVIAPNPESPDKEPVKRMITLTTCEPKYATPIYRWISYGEFDYWAKVSDGIPKELSTVDESGHVRFINNEQQSLISHLDSLVNPMIVVSVLYVIVFIAGAAAWRWPLRKKIREGVVKKPDASIFGGIARLQPGILFIRLVLQVLLYLLIIMILMQWIFPWLSANIPFLQRMSNYTPI